MNDGNSFKKPDRDETRRYVEFHVTNYAMSALEALGAAPDGTRLPPTPTLSLQHLKAWLADRDLRDPWQEGNNIVNLASFLLVALRSAETGGARRHRSSAGHPV